MRVQSTHIFSATSDRTLVLPSKIINFSRLLLLFYCYRFWRFCTNPFPVCKWLLSIHPFLHVSLLGKTFSSFHLPSSLSFLSPTCQFSASKYPDEWRDGRMFLSLQKSYSICLRGCCCFFRKREGLEVCFPFLSPTLFLPTCCWPSVVVFHPIHDFSSFVPFKTTFLFLLLLPLSFLPSWPEQHWTPPLVVCPPPSSLCQR